MVVLGWPGGPVLFSKDCWNPPPKMRNGPHGARDVRRREPRGDHRQTHGSNSLGQRGKIDRLLNQAHMAKFIRCSSSAIRRSSRNLPGVPPSNGRISVAQHHLLDSFTLSSSPTASPGPQPPYPPARPPAAPPRAHAPRARRQSRKRPSHCLARSSTTQSEARTHHTQQRHPP